MKDEYVSDSSEIISSMLGFETELAAWAMGLPLSWSYSTAIAADSTDEVFEGYFHIYQDIWTASIWNNYRCIRILVNEYILGYLTRLTSATYPFMPSEHRIQHQQSRNVLSQLASDICASVPFHLGHAHIPLQSSLSEPPALGGYVLLWPLYIAATMDGGSKATRLWIAQRLKSIGDTMGIQQALSFSSVLKSARIIAYWKSQMEGSVEGWVDINVDNIDEEEEEWRGHDNVFQISESGGRIKTDEESDAWNKVLGFQKHRSCQPPVGLLRS